MTSPTPRILARLRGVQRAGKGWLAYCPAHDDQEKRSLSIALGDDGRTLVKCFARGCTVQAIAQAVGMTVADLMSANGAANGHRPPAGRREVARYDYHDERGRLLYQVVRYEPKDFRPRRPDGRGGWTWALDGVRRVVYRLDELAEQRRVVLVEGEKDVDRLWNAGIPATTSPGGASAWRPDYAEQIRAAGVEEVIILPDNDEPGRRYAAVAGAALSHLGVRVRVLELPGLPPKGDVSEWLDTGHTADELLALLAQAPLAAPTEAPATGPVLVRLDTVAPTPVEWVWPGRLARGKLTLLIGEPGAGKSRTSHDVAARITCGLPWPDGGQAPRGDVVMLVSEDGLADTVRPQIDIQGGDPSRVHVLRAVRDEGQERPFNLERDLPALEAALTATRAVLCILSPLSAYLGARDSYKDAEVRALLDPLAQLAERLGVAILAILHLTKNQARRLLNRAQGSIAFVAVARIVLAVGTTPEPPNQRLLATVKNNLGPEAPALAFRIADYGLTWSETPIPGTADRLLAADEPLTRTEQRERDIAAAFLRDMLSNGPVASKQIEADAKANGIAQRTLWRAKADLGIVAERARTHDGRTAGWYWQLPVEGA